MTSKPTDRPAKPPRMDVRADAIPAELRELRRWVLWRWQWKQKAGKYDKPPLRPNGNLASSTNPKTWYTFDQVRKFIGINGDQFDGVGFVLGTETGIVGVDFDDCRDPSTGAISEPAASWIRELESYCEVSPSGTGVKLLVRGTLPAKCRKVNEAVGIEVYPGGRYFTLTGHCVPGTPATINERTDKLAWLIREFVEPSDVQRGNIHGVDIDADGTTDIETARSALAGLSSSRANGYWDWLQVGMALHSVSDQLLSDWDQWSRQSNKWVDGACRRKWNTFSDGKIGIGTLVYWALQDGWKPTGTHQDNGSASKPTGKRTRDKTHQDAVGSTLTLAEGRTELANAKRLVARYGDVIRWCDPWGRWLVWDGTRWKLDDCRRIDTLATKVVNDLWDEAAAASKDAEENTVKAMWRFAAASNQANAIRNMVSLARCDVPILPATLDQHPWLLNLPDGTLDLRTGDLRPHRKADYLTQLCPVPYQPKAQFPLWQAFLRTILRDDKDLVGYIQRLTGLCLTGSTQEHILPFCYGVGANGKSTLVNTILALLGPDYAIKAPTDLLLAKRDTHPTERADLYGKRFVACVEAEDGRRLAESLVKELSGGDRVRARRMREDFWEFQATHKIWLAANHKPTVRGTDHGIWRRIKLLPFTVTIPDDQQDKALPTKLLTELPGILQWALEGCRQWLQDGLREPECVRAATGDYRDEMDLVGRFINDCCEVGPELSVGATALFKRFKEWCDDTGERGFNQTRFGSRMTERGFESEKTRTVVLRHGLSLVGDSE